jgi:hypothetical protein
LVVIEGVPPDMRTPPEGCPFATRCAYSAPECFHENPSLEPVQDSVDGHVTACWLDLRAPQMLRAEPRVSPDTSYQIRDLE